MGPLPDLAVATHQAGGAFGMIWIECGTNFKALPPTGAFYALLPAKHAGGSGGEARVLAITEPKLAARLIEAARGKRVAHRKAAPQAVVRLHRIRSVTFNRRFCPIWHQG